MEIKECEEKIYQKLRAGVYACEKTFYEETADCTEPDKCRWGAKIKGHDAYRQCEMDYLKKESELLLKLLRCTNSCDSRSERCFGDEDCLKNNSGCGQGCYDEYRPESRTAAYNVYPCYQQTFAELTGQLAECCELAEPKFEHGKRDNYACRQKAYLSMVTVAQTYANCMAAENEDCLKKAQGPYGTIYRDWGKCKGEQLELYLRERQAFNPGIAKCGMDCDGAFFAKVMQCSMNLSDDVTGLPNCWYAAWPELTDCRYECAKANDLLPARESKALYSCRSKAILAAQKCFYNEKGQTISTWQDCMKTVRQQIKSCEEQLERDYGGRQYSPATNFATGAIDRFTQAVAYNGALPAPRAAYLNFADADWLNEYGSSPYNESIGLFREPWNCFNWWWIFMGSSEKFKN
ncbi:MAG: hypothetical protein LBK76_09815 [Verrucomicrobiales bacterium]|nr:hypothetical protein [Verrucomicrobiales bacterium]